MADGSACLEAAGLRPQDSAGGDRSAARPARVCYHIQTHTRPAQIARLVDVIKEGNPRAIVLISHDRAGAPLDVAQFEARPGVHVLIHRGGYGDFSHLERYFAAVDWLDERGIEFGWLENITGQDYPLRPIAEIEHALVTGTTDGYLLYAPVFPECLPPGADWGAGPEYRLCKAFDASMRYGYRSWRIGRPTRAKQRWLRPVMAIDFVQPWVRVSLAYSSVGVRRKSTIFGDDFVLYGGSFQCTLSAACARYARDFAKENPDIVAFFRSTLAPEEVFLQTVLVNSGKFRLQPDAKRYVDFTNSYNNHPRTLGLADLETVLASGAHWARKFDMDRDSAALDQLDRHVRMPGRALT